jgi:hypothetical protein
VTGDDDLFFLGDPQVPEKLALRFGQGNTLLGVSPICLSHVSASDLRTSGPDFQVSSQPFPPSPSRIGQGLGMEGDEARSMVTGNITASTPGSPSL